MIIGDQSQMSDTSSIIRRTGVVVVDIENRQLNSPPPSYDTLDLESSMNLQYELPPPSFSLINNTRQSY
jgi:hypothetical protein